MQDAWVVLELKLSAIGLHIIALHLKMFFFYVTLLHLLVAWERYQMNAELYLVTLLISCGLSPLSLSLSPVGAAPERMEMKKKSIVFLCAMPLDNDVVRQGGESYIDLVNECSTYGGLNHQEHPPSANTAHMSHCVSGCFDIWIQKAASKMHIWKSHDHSSTELYCPDPHQHR